MKITRPRKTAGSFATVINFKLLLTTPEKSPRYSMNRSESGCHSISSTSPSYIRYLGGLQLRSWLPAKLSQDCSEPTLLNLRRCNKETDNSHTKLTFWSLVREDQIAVPQYGTGCRPAHCRHSHSAHLSTSRHGSTSPIIRAGRHCM